MPANCHFYTLIIKTLSSHRLRTRQHGCNLNNLPANCYTCPVNILTPLPAAITAAEKSNDTYK